jgi:hypothetical protein
VHGFLDGRLGDHLHIDQQSSETDAALHPARMPAGQNVSVGSCADTITIKIIF